ncbi:MAG: hypothetical protein AB7E61_05980 [Acholeplasmataceae bacterium]
MELKQKSKYSHINILIFILYILIPFFAMKYTIENNITTILFAVYLISYLILTTKLFTKYIYGSKKKETDSVTIMIIQMLFIMIVILTASWIYQGFILYNFIAVIVFLVTLIIMIVYIKRGLHKQRVYRLPKVRCKYIPNKNKFTQYLIEYVENNSNIFSDVLNSVYNEHIDKILIDRLPIKIIHKNYHWNKKGFDIHFEGVYKEQWLQSVFTNEGFQLLFDGFIPNNKFHQDAIIEYNNFQNMEELYKFIIDAFEYHYHRIENDDLDSPEDFDAFFTH